MSGGASAKTMYDQMVDMFKHFPTLKIDWKLFPILPPAVVVNEAVQTAAKIEGEVAERQHLENEKLRIEIEKEKRALGNENQASAPEETDTSEDETDTSSEEDTKPSAPSEEELSDASKKDKEKIGGDPSDILFTKKECSFF